MPIQKETQVLQTVLDNYETERERILTTRDLSQEGKNKRVDALRQTAMSAANTSVTRLWGAVVEQDGAKTLDKRSLIWNGLIVAERAINKAKMDAERFNIDPAFIMLARDRAASLIRMAKTPDELKQMYSAASQDVKLVLQEGLPSMLSADRYHNTAYVGVISHIEADRRQRLNTPAVKAANEAASVVMNQAIEALSVTKKAANLFRNWDASIGEILSYIQFTQSFLQPNADYPEGGFLRSLDRRRDMGMVMRDNMMFG